MCTLLTLTPGTPAQPGERFRTFDPARQERFITRISEMLLDDGCNAEIRRVWVGYLTQCDADLGKRVAQKLTAKSAL